MRLAPIMLEEHAWRTMQLRYDNPLRTIDHERSVGRHERNFAHVNFLLFDFLDRIWSLTVQNHQANPCTQRRCKCQPALMAFSHIESWFAEHKADEFKPSIPRMRNDREDRVKRCLQAFVFAIFSRNIGL